MNTSPYDFGIKNYSYRQPTCQGDMQGMLDKINTQYLYQYNVALMALLSCAEDFVLSQQIIHEMTTLKSYLNYMFGALFAFPQLSHYRPMLLFYIVEIDKCVNNYQQWQLFREQNLDKSKQLLCDVSSPIANQINNQTNTLLNDFLEFRGGLIDVIVDEQIFRQDADIKSFDEELSDILDLLIECERLHNLTLLHKIYNPILSYLSVMLLGYAFVLRPSFLLGLVRVQSRNDYVSFLKKDQFINSMRGFYGDRGKSLTSDFDPQRSYYFRGTDPTIKLYKYHYLSDSDQNYDSTEQMDMKIYYVCLNPDTDEFSIIGTDKEDFKTMALLEEEITMPILCLGLDQSMIDILSSPDDHRDKQEIKNLIQDQNIRLTLTTKLDSESGFTVSIVDSGGRIADTFIFTLNELKQLQDSSH